MDIDFIKWMCEKAEGFEWIQKEKLSGEHAVSLNGLVYRIKDFEDEFKKNIYPLLLQRAIEGVNRDSPEWLQIAQCGYSVQILTSCNRDVVKNFDVNTITTIDKAKESALKYIYEQEAK